MSEKTISSGSAEMDFLILVFVNAAFLPVMYTILPTEGILALVPILLSVAHVTIGLKIIGLRG